MISSDHRSVAPWGRCALNEEDLRALSDHKYGVRVGMTSEIWLRMV